MPGKPYDSSTCLFESSDGDVESVLVALGSLALMYQRFDVRAHTFGVEPVGAQETVDLVLQSRGLNANRSNPIMLASSSSMRDWSCFSVDGAWGLWAGLDAGLGAAGAWVVVGLRGAWGLATLCIRKSEAKRSRLTKVLWYLAMTGATAFTTDLTAEWTGCAFLGACSAAGFE